MVSRAILGLLFFASLPSFAQVAVIDLNRCAGDGKISQNESFLKKVDCVYRIFGEQVGGDDTPIKALLVNNKFKETRDRLKAATRELLATRHWEQEVVAKCDTIKGDPLDSVCVVTNFPEFTDVLLTAKAVREVTLPSMLPMNPPNTVGQLRDGHLALLRQQK